MIFKREKDSYLSVFRYNTATLSGAKVLQLNLLTVLSTHHQMHIYMQLVTVTCLLPCQNLERK